MDEIFKSIKNINIVDFFVQNLLWEVVALLLFGFLFKKLYDTYKIHRTARLIAFRLLSENRPARNGKSALFLADRFIQIWNWDSNRNQPLRFDNKQQYTPPVFSKCIFHEVALHKILKELELIQVNDDPQKTIAPIKNKINTTVYRICTNYLVKYYFDDRKEYSK